MLKILLAVTKKQKSISILSGHYYGSPSKYGAAEEIGGGKHMRLAPHIILSLKKSKLFNTDKEVIGNVINAITLKNRFFPAFQECSVEINYKDGVNVFSGLDKIAMEAGIISKGGAWYTNTLTQEKVQGTAKLNQLLDEKTLHEIDKYILTTGYSTINKEIENVMKEADKIISEDLEAEE
jgi:hypothetical protein